MPVEPLASRRSLGEEVHATVQDGDLEVESERLEVGRGAPEHTLELLGPVELREHHVGGVTLHRRMGGVREEQAEAAQQRLQGVMETVHEGPARPKRFLE